MSARVEVDFRAVPLPWPRQCGYCRGWVEAHEARGHWQQPAGVSRCDLRPAVTS